jgi:hypothetical protein
MRLSHDDAYQLAREEGPDLRARRQRTARRAKVNEFLANRNYWLLMRFLVERSGSLGFLSLAEAQRQWRFHRAAGTLIDGTTEGVRMRFVVARYFNKIGRAWL